MKKILLFVLALVLLITCTACSSADRESVSVSEEDPLLPQFEEILRCYKIYLISNYDFPTEDGLPLVRGTKTRPALKDVLEENDKTSGELRGLLERFVKEKNLPERISLTHRIMEILVGADDIPGGDGLVSEKKLAALRAFWGENADRDIISPVTPGQAELIEQSYVYLVEHYCLSLMCSIYYDYIHRIYDNERGNGETYPDMYFFSSKINYSVDELDEDMFYDICLAMGYYGTLEFDSYEAYSEFRGYMEDRIIDNSWWWDEDDKHRLFFPLIDKALEEINGVLDGVHELDVVIGGDGDDELVGSSANELIVGGSGNDVLNGGAGNDFLQGGEGDDVYVFRANCGDNVIFDTDGVNVLRFRGIPLENIYVSSVEDVDHEDDVKITFVGGKGSVTIRDFKDEWREWSFRIEAGSKQLDEDDPESPFMYIDDKGRLPQGVMPPMNR